MYRSPSPTPRSARNTLRSDPTAAARSSIRRHRVPIPSRVPANGDRTTSAFSSRRSSPALDRLFLLEIARRDRDRDRDRDRSDVRQPSEPSTNDYAQAHTSRIPARTPTGGFYPDTLSDAFDDFGPADTDPTSFGRAELTTPSNGPNAASTEDPADLAWRTDLAADRGFARSRSNPFNPNHPDSATTSRPTPSNPRESSSLRYELTDDLLTRTSPRFAPAYRHELFTPTGDNDYGVAMTEPLLMSEPGRREPTADNARDALHHARARAEIEHLQRQRDELLWLQERARRVGARMERDRRRRDSDGDGVNARNHSGNWSRLRREPAPSRIFERSRSRSPGTHAPTRSPRRDPELRAGSDTQITISGTIDGLGDRRRSPSPEESTWETMRTTVPLDARLPTSAHTSFNSASDTASESLSRSLTRNTSRSRSGRASRTASDRGSAASTAITVPSPPSAAAPPDQLQNCDTPDSPMRWASDDDDVLFEALATEGMSRRAAHAAGQSGQSHGRPAVDGPDTPPRNRRRSSAQARLNRRLLRELEDDDGELGGRQTTGDETERWQARLRDEFSGQEARPSQIVGSQEINQMRAILERLERQENVPEEWWAAAGLVRGFEREGRAERL